MTDTKDTISQEAAEGGPRAPEELAVPASGTPAVWDPHTGAWTHQQAKRPKRRRPASTSRAAIAGGLAGAVVAVAVALPVAFLAGGDRPASVEQRLAEPLPAVGGNGASIVDIAARARPWVVNVNISAGQQTVFGDVEVQGTGSGIIMRSDGHIITNAHVVQDATAIEVTLASGERLDARIVGTDVETDVAVIRVERTDLPAAVMGSVRDVQVGELAVAIGSPLGLEQSVTSGIVSALGRRLDRGGGLPPLFDMIQTDAPITQGNSGGALVSGSGAVIGINTAIAASPDVGAEGVAFAIPIDVAAAVASELIRFGRATHPWLGVTGANITPEAAEQFGVEQGAFISEVLPGSPADVAGLRPNDVVVRFDGEAIESMDDLVVAIRSRRVGDLVGLEVIRDGERIPLRATLGDKPDNL